MTDPAGDDAPDPDAERTDDETLRALAVAVVENAIYYVTARSAAVSDAERADARAFLLDPGDRRLDSWLSILAVDPEALRAGIRRRLGERGERAA